MTTATLTKKGIISRNPNVMNGMFCIKGTRIPIKHIKFLKKAGVSVENIKKKHYPNLTTDQIKSVLKLSDL